MTEQEITNSNKLMAEFMGGKMIVTDYHGINIIEFPDKSTKDLRGLKYNKSYDWLMPVVEKIESLNYKTTIISTLLFSGEMLHIMAITDNDDDITYWNKKGNTKIEAIYNCVITFIKYYNESK